MLAAALLCALLAHQDFPIRQSAHDAIEHLGALAQPALTLATGSADPEVASRACRLLDRLKVETDPTALWLRSFLGLPYCDSLPWFGEYLGAARTELIERGLPPSTALWLEFRLATLLWLRANGPIDPITLALMTARSAHWDARGCYPP